MKIFRIPENCRAVIFDMDSTLYTNKEYEKQQVDVLIERFASLRGKSFDEANWEISGYRKEWTAKNGGSISLGNTLAAFGISIEESVKWRNELVKPRPYIHPDAVLRSTLENLSGFFSLAVVTNNSVAVANETLDALGVADLFRAVVGLDTCWVSKPHKAPLAKAASLCAAPVETCLSVGDRYDIDIALPLAIGMGGILVDGVEDVYRLPDVLLTEK